MIIEQETPQTTVLQTLSLAVGIVLGGSAAAVLIILIILATMELNLGPTITSLPAYLPESWREQIQIMGFPLQGETTAYWYMSRVSALLAYLFVWGSTAWGLLLSTKMVKSIVPPAFTLSTHEFLSWLGLGFATFHALILLGDQYIKFGLSDILIPFNASFEPFWIGVGTITLYLYALIIGSFYFKKRIGHKTWRTLHYLSFAFYGMVLTHGLMIGTDSTLNLMKLVYLGSGSSILFLTYYRILSTNSTPRKRTMVKA